MSSVLIAFVTPGVQAWDLASPEYHVLFINHFRTRVTHVFMLWGLWYYVSQLLIFCD